MTRLQRLFEPIAINSMWVKNRIAMAALTTYSANFDGTISDRIIAFYEARARGGAGLIVPSAFFITPDSAAPHCLSLHEDRFIAPFAQMCKALHKHGAKVAAQLAHPGIGLARIWQGYEAPADLQAVGPSAVPCIPWRTTPRALAREEIGDIVEAYGVAALRAIEAGADAIEVHAAHGYMIGAFFSPLKNRRTDEYGGSRENRARFALDCLRSVRRSVGPGFPILFRFNASDGLEGGTTLEDSLVMSPWFVDAGADALDITAGARESPWWDDAVYLRPAGLLVPMAEAIKKTVQVPVMVSGKLGDPLLAEQVLESGGVDIIAMARPLLADPDLPRKAEEGRLEDIRYCIHCGNCRLDLFDRERLKRRGATLGCTVNPAVMREAEYGELTPTQRSKRVIVVGGGLAGIEAARTLAERGHDVELHEKESQLGGQWNIACREPQKEHFKSATEWRIRQLRKTAARVFLSSEVTAETIRASSPDVVVLATGASNIVLDAPGINKPHVVQATDVLLGKVAVGERVVIVGGRLRGMEMADMLAGQGKRVSIVTKAPLGVNGAPLERNTFYELFTSLIERKVTVYEMAPLVEILDKGVYIDYRNELFFLPADTIVLAVGARSENRLAKELEGLGLEMYVVGDCQKPGYARDAVEAGAALGRQI